MWYFETGRYVGALTGLILFAGLWIFSIMSYGILIGGGIGWLPSLFVAAAVGALLIPLWGLAGICAGVVGFFALRDSGEPLVSLVVLAALPIFVGWVIVNQARDWWL
jgi:hypothetical protein